MLDIPPIRLPNTQNLQPPLRPIPLHPRDHPTHHTLRPSFQKRPTILLPQHTLIPKLKHTIQKRRPIMVQIVNDEMLFPTRLRFAPGLRHARVQLEDHVLVAPRCLAAGVEGFAYAEAGS